MILGLPDHKSTLRPEGDAPGNLSEWLDIATRELVTLAQKRIRAEIGAHFTEAVHSHQVSGSTEAEAQSAALAELGDAHAAAVRFRREHLTNWDAKSVFFQATGQISIGMVWAICNALDVFYPKPVGAAVGLLIVLSALLIQLTVALLVRWSRQVVTWRMVLLLLSFQWLNLVGFMWMIHFNQTDDQVIYGFRRLMVVGFILLAVGNSFSLLRLRRKLASKLDYDLSSDNRPTA